MKKTVLVALPCILIDQVVKLILLNTVNIGTSNEIIKDFFSITLVLNDGAAFSILKSKVLFLIIMSLIVIISLFIYLKKADNVKNIEYILYGILTGGIIGNLIDRIVHKSVVDYLDFNIFGYPFPVFNFADMCIVISIFTIVILAFRGEKNENRG